MTLTWNRWREKGNPVSEGKYKVVEEITHRGNQRTGEKGGIFLKKNAGVAQRWQWRPEEVLLTGQNGADAP